MQQRNEYMVDNSSILIAIYNGALGGTEKPIGYAKLKNILVKIIEP